MLLVLALGTPAVFLLALDREQVDGLAAGSGPRHLLVVGSDEREGLSEQQQGDLAVGFEPGVRTDTIFVLSTDGSRAAVLAFPRDLYVERCDGSTGRINRAVEIGGAQCIVETVEQLSGLSISGVLQVDFLGFRDLVDAVGGVEVCLPEAIQDADSGADLPAGSQVLDGTQALSFVRVRKIDDDLQRIARQQQFLAALADRLSDPAVVANPLRWWPTAWAAGQALTADDDLGPGTLISLARPLRTVAGGGLVTTTVPVEPATIGGASVLLATDDAEEVYAAQRSGAVLAEQPPLDAPVADPDDVGVAEAAAPPPEGDEPAEAAAAPCG